MRAPYLVRSFHRKNGHIRHRVLRGIRRTVITSGIITAIVLLLGPMTWHRWIWPQVAPGSIGGVAMVQASQEAPPTHPGATSFDCVASWYSESDPWINARMANGERFDDGELVVAMRNVASYGTRVKITAKETGAVVFARITDYGPHKRFNNRCVDLSRATWEATGVAKAVGLQNVHIEILQGANGQL